MGAPVILTRATGQVGALAAALGAQGHEVLLFPALEVGPLSDAEPLRAMLGRLESFGLAIFVSPNAIEATFAQLDRPWPEEVALAVMGPGSLAALAARGIATPGYRIFTPSDEEGEEGYARYDSESLYGELERSSATGGPILIFKGNGGRTWLAEALLAAGAAVTTVQCYERSRGRPDTAARAKLSAWIAERRVVQLVVSSSEGLHNLVGLVEEVAGPGARGWLFSQRLLTGHSRIAQNATALGFTQAEICGQGDSQLIEALK